MSDELQLFNETLRRRVREWVLRVRDDWGRCKEIVLRHYAKQDENVNSWPIGREDRAEDEADAIARQIELAASEDAAGLSGMQRYVVYPKFEKTGATVVARYPFRLQGRRSDEEFDEDGHVSEPPTSRGLMTQLMRHTEASTRLAVMSSAGIIREQNVMIETLMRERRELMVAERALLQEQERLESQAHVRSLDVRKVEHREEMMVQLYRDIRLILPHVVNTVAKKRIMPEPKEGLSGLKMFVGSLNEDQLQGIMSNLSPQQQIAMADLIAEFAEADESEKPEKPKNGKRADA